MCMYGGDETIWWQGETQLCASFGAIPLATCYSRQSEMSRLTVVCALISYPHRNGERLCLCICYAIQLNMHSMRIAPPSDVVWPNAHWKHGVNQSELINVL